ncbi:MAG: hypothetical protein IOD12_15915 [Silvanigrellales bacterium]|jgi:hypothetical protein|nr:hypothetical protein [Silvanigrellales bacterium]
MTSHSKKSLQRFLPTAFKAPLFTVAAVALLAACGGDKTVGDPEILSKGELNPPMNLQSITDDSTMSLEWIITNTEEDLAGYNVYVAESSIDALSATLAGTPLAALDLSSQQVRRCKDTAKLFKVFGFSDTADQGLKDCDDFGTEDDTPLEAASAASGAAPSVGSPLDEPAGTTPTLVKCVDSNNKDLGTAGKLSISIEKGLAAMGETSGALEARAGRLMRCIVPNDSKLSDGKKGFTNGKKYVAFVVAVAGEEANTISYTSNFVEDIPTAYTNLKLEGLASETYQRFAINVTTGTAAKEGAAESCNKPLVGTANCRLGQSLGIAAGADDAPTFAFVEDAQANSERVFVTGQKDKVFLLPARPRNDFDAPKGGSFSARPGIQEPGDTVLSATSGLYEDDTNFEVLPGNLYYVAVSDGAGKYNYGKLYVKAVSTATAATATTVGTGAKTVEALFALQSAKDELFAETPFLARLGRLFP